jgi:pimeloyl-ACP methyl ester carboxylesterase/DNA-binding SARP family transcriptional activator
VRRGAIDRELEPAESVLRIRVLGELALALDGEELEPPASRRARSLLGLLAVERRAHPRSQLAARFWPDVLDQSARTSLRSALSALRRALGPNADRYLIAGRETVALAGADLVWTDLAEFERLLAAGEVEEALEVSRGELLEELDDEWVFEYRDEHRDRVAGTLEQLAAGAEERGELQSAVAFTRRRVALDPLAEDAQRELIRRLAAAGDRAGALAAYKRLQERLRNDLGIAPSAQARELVESLRGDAGPAAPPARIAEEAAPASPRPAAPERVDRTAPYGGSRVGIRPAASDQPLRMASPAAGVTPETRYAQSGQVNIAYQVVGEGPLDLVFVMGWVSHMDYFWEEPSFARFLRRLASFSRLILFDKRGTGLSDRVLTDELPTLEQRMEDVHAVMDAVGSERAALVGISEGGPLCTLFAATYPQRTAALVMLGCYARRIWHPDYPCGASPESYQAFLEEIRTNWGGPVGLGVRAPSLIDDDRFRQWWATYLRMSASPGAALALTRMNGEIDVRHALPSVRVPTLIVHRTGDRSIPVEGSRYMAERIPGAKYVELAGDDHLPFVGNQDEILDEIEEFLTGMRHGPEPDRVLATVLFTDVVASTERAAELGDHRWRLLIEGHHAEVRRQLDRFRGVEVNTAGDAFLATFDGPARAIRYACAIRAAVGAVGLEARVGLHTGEVELMGDDIGGIAVHIGSRVASKANAGEILVSSTVKDLVAGSGIEFDDRGVHELKGVPEKWHLYRVVDD